MRILSLYAENIKRLRAVEITPTGALVEISGANAQGKSSILDAMWWSLTSAKHIQAVPIRKGENTATIRLDLGDLKVTRKFRRNKDGDVTTSLVVENAEGARYPTPQAIVDSLVGSLSMDPLAFMRSDPREQLRALRAFVPNVDFAATEEANKADFKARADENRQAKILRAQAEGITVSGGPVELVDESALVADLEEAGKHNALIEKRRALRQRADDEVRKAAGLAKHLRDKAAEARAQADRFDAEATEYEHSVRDQEARFAAASSLPAPRDTATIREEIEQARSINTAVEQRRRREAIENQAAVHEARAEKLTDAMVARKADLDAAVRAAAMPVPGLTFDDEDVLLNGLPLDQASDAEQLRTSIAIAMAMNPTLRVLRVRDGSLLDENSIRLLDEMAKAQEFQVWIELVDTSGKIGFVIEDGTVVARPSAPADKIEKA